MTMGEPTPPVDPPESLAEAWRGARHKAKSPRMPPMSMLRKGDANAARARLTFPTGIRVSSASRTRDSRRYPVRTNRF
jgi:hypothetical protein